MSKIEVAGLVAGIVSAAGGLAATYFSWKGPTHKDLQRVEANTADTVLKLADVHEHLENMNLRLDEQNMRAMIDSSSQRVSIAVAGNAARGQPLDVTLTLVLEDVVLTQIELFNQIDMKSGEANCTRRDPRIYIATIHPIVYEPWYASGTEDPTDERTAILKLRAHLIMVDQRVHRDFVVKLRIGQPPHTDPVFRSTVFVSIEGSC